MNGRSFGRQIGSWCVGAICIAVAGAACDGAEPATVRSLADRSQRGTLHDAAAFIRGDTGRWQDAERSAIATAPPVAARNRFALDDHLDRAMEKKFSSTTDDDVWLIFSTRQLNDNDRVWIERIERSGNGVTIVMTQAIWRGKYFKNFTGYHVFGVNLGKLAAGSYDVRWVLQPAAFVQFEGDGRPQDAKQNLQWPQDDRPTEGKPAEFSEAFVVKKAGT
jgi:hypothetical protein